MCVPIGYLEYYDVSLNGTRRCVIPKGCIASKGLLFQDVVLILDIGSTLQFNK